MIQITPLIPLSEDTLNLSFAKYLDLRFNAVDVKNRTVVLEREDGKLEREFVFMSAALRLTLFSFWYEVCNKK